MEAEPVFESAAGHLERALIQRLTGDPEKDHAIHARIVDVERRLLGMNPFNPFVRTNLAEALYNIGDKEQAAAELLRAVEAEPNYVSGYLKLAQWYAQSGQHHVSDKYSQKAVEVVTRYKDETTLDVYEALLLGRPSDAVRQQ